MKLKLLVLVLITLFTSGCVNHNIVIEHTAKSKKGNELGTVCLNKFEDIRVEKARIGYWVNGYGFESGDILTEQDVTIVLSKSIEDELTNLGYKVNLVNVTHVDGEDSTNNCTFIDGKVKIFFIESGAFPIPYSTSAIVIDLFIQNESGKEYKKTFSVEYTANSMWAVTAGLGKESMDLALDKLMIDIASELPAIVGK